jgi:hypothetical protein
MAEITVTQGGSQTFTATPNNGKEVDKWLLNGSAAQTGGTTYTLSNVQANATLQVTFKDTQAANTLQVDPKALRRSRHQPARPPARHTGGPYRQHNT